jgi:hypothetical protein
VDLLPLQCLFSAGAFVKSPSGPPPLLTSVILASAWEVTLDFVLFIVLCSPSKSQREYALPGKLHRIFLQSTAGVSRVFVFYLLDGVVMCLTLSYSHRLLVCLTGGACLLESGPHSHTCFYLVLLGGS